MKKTIFIFSLLMLLISSVTTVYANPSNSTEISDSGVVVIEDFNTKKTSETPVALTVEIDVPNGFGQSCFAIIVDENNQEYRVSCTEANEYRGVIYLAEGNFYIDRVGVYEDNISKYTFSISDTEGFVNDMQFNTKIGEPNLISFVLNDYEIIEEEIKNNTTKEENVENEKEEKTEDLDVYYKSGVDGLVVDSGGNVFYTVTHTGSTKVTARAYGNALSNADIVFRITKGGVIGEAVIELSEDGGQTYTNSVVTNDTILIGTLGVTIEFIMENDAEMFVEGDTFSFKVTENFKVAYNSGVEEGFVTVIGHPTSDHNMLITMLSSGGRGVSRFNISYDNGTTIALQDIVPKDGYYALDDDITLVFSEGNYGKGMQYTVEIESNDKGVSYVPIIVIGVSAVVLLIFAYFVMISKKEKNSEYRINKYYYRKGEADYE